MRTHGKIRRGLLLLAVVCLMLQLPMRASANQATSYTYAADENGYWVRTQDAYLPDKTVTELGLSAPEDLFIDENNMLYIADTVHMTIDSGYRQPPYRKI